MERIIAPSLLASDLGNLERETRMLDRSAAGWVHVDVMDGVFVPNISFGPGEVEAIRRATKKLVDVHIMIVDPARYAVRFVEAGADQVTFHWEAVAGLDAARAIVAAIHAAGSRAGISLRPATPAGVLEEILPELDNVLVMSVEPGFGGQRFQPASLDKVRALRRVIDSRGLRATIEIDGGVTLENAGELFAAGCEVLVSGSAIFGSGEPERAIREMLNV